MFSYLAQTNLVNKRIYLAFGENFRAGHGGYSPERAGFILPTWVANHSAEFESSCPLEELGIS